MIWVFAIGLVLAMGGVAAVATGRGAGLAPDEDDEQTYGAPGGADVTLSASGLRAVRFPIAVRGYRMADVDALLDRLARAEEQRERQTGPSGDPRPTQDDEPLSDR